MLLYAKCWQFNFLLSDRKFTYTSHIELWCSPGEFRKVKSMGFCHSRQKNLPITWSSFPAKRTSEPYSQAEGMARMALPLCIWVENSLRVRHCKYVFPKSGLDLHFSCVCFSFCDRGIWTWENGHHSVSMHFCDFWDHRKLRLEGVNSVPLAQVQSSSW